MVTSPYIGDHFEFVRLISDYCKNKNVTYLDYSSSKRYVDDMYLWKDEAHLNEKGAEMFSEELVRHLKRQNLLN
jgi:lysophospholipase L1-like esterase